jgi:hypothetical protein
MIHWQIHPVLHKQQIDTHMNYITKCAQRTVFSEVHSDLLWVYLVLVWKRNLVCIVHTQAH